MVSTEPNPAPTRILKRDVEGIHCAPQDSGLASYGEAVQAALAGVPEADVLLNASVYFRGRGLSTCVVASGDAGRFE